ncbi:type I restriction-modification system subunit M [Syntrophomonas wolfei]|mgnify:CR=1 FL=1|jgi:type I restriction enzyme M protein|uniref:type I restriction-modification system subunit M n=1 Tax=Syntrophomonas wolfei TaxID=863 RepID=UPI0023F452AC|nr:class I SAM-dependent DNA methyltransferase [Syntrophomonas wolfei]
MDTQTYNQIVAFIWGIANDCLVDTYDVGDYRKIILPMTVIRRFDAVLEETKEAVLKEKARLDAENVQNQDAWLCNVSKEAFCNWSPHTLKSLSAITNRLQLKQNFENYLNGFTQNIQDIINRFHFRQEINRLSESDTLGVLISKYVDRRINLSSRPVLNDDGSVRLPALDNHSMGMVFEEVIRRFNEETNVTDAGRHFTPRDIVRLMADLAFIPVQCKIKAKNNSYTIYDGACGTGGMLTVAEERILEIAHAGGKRASINLFGQENADETYAIARSDMLVKGEGEQASNIIFGSTISDDKFRGQTFDFMLSNPPFGTSWRKELDAWGGIKKEEISDPRFNADIDGEDVSLVPDIDDPQMLFLANNVSKMKTNTKLGSRIIEVHNGSSLFTGKAGQGSTNLRRYIIEQDLLEAIVALPEKMFYNTGIGTYLWVLANKKSPERKGKVQLINASSLKSLLRKNIGEKNCEITPELRDQIMDIYLAYESADPEYSLILNNADFGYYSVNIQRPLRLAVNITEDNLAALKKSEKDDILYEVLSGLKIESMLSYKSFVSQVENALEEYKKANPRTRASMTKNRLKLLRDLFTVVDENAEPVELPEGGFEPNKDMTENEIVPLTFEGGVEAFFETEVKPYSPDAWYEQDSIKIGYEISFTKYFYKPADLRDVTDIVAEIQALERETDGLLNEVLGGLNL